MVIGVKPKIIRGEKILETIAFVNNGCDADTPQLL